jgi:hypothetical protein
MINTSTTLSNTVVGAPRQQSTTVVVSPVKIPSTFAYGKSSDYFTVGRTNVTAGFEDFPESKWTQGNTNNSQLPSTLNTLGSTSTFVPPKATQPSQSFKNQTLAHLIHIGFYYPTKTETTFSYNTGASDALTFLATKTFMPVSLTEFKIGTATTTVAQTIRQYWS